MGLGKISHRFEAFVARIGTHVVKWISIVSDSPAGLEKARSAVHRHRHGQVRIIRDRLAGRISGRAVDVVLITSIDTSLECVNSACAADILYGLLVVVIVIAAFLVLCKAILAIVDAFG